MEIFYNLIQRILLLLHIYFISIEENKLSMIKKAKFLTIIKVIYIPATN